MRRRWRVEWPGWLADWEPVERLLVLGLAWCAFGLCALIVTVVITTLVYGDDRTSLAFYLVMLVGEGVPFGGAFVVGVWLGVRWLLRGGVFRRVSESGPDLRDAYRRP